MTDEEIGRSNEFYAGYLSDEKTNPRMSFVQCIPNEYSSESDVRRFNELKERGLI